MSKGKLTMLLDAVTFLCIVAVGLIGLINGVTVTGFVCVWLVCIIQFGINVIDSMTDGRYRDDNNRPAI